MTTEPHTEHELDLVLVRKETIADGVVRLTLRHPDGESLPGWKPGAHVDLVLTDDMTRQYSLCGNPHDRSILQVAVLREEAGRGGSRYVHDVLVEGQRVHLRGPRNHFALVETRRYLFIAGGIGITPILPMIDAAAAAGAQWELHYGGRSRRSMAFLESLERDSGHLTLHPQDEVGLIDLDALLGTPRPDTRIYCCGPEPLLVAVEQRCADWPTGSLHLERFAPKDVGEPVLTGAFEVELALTGRTLTVPPDRSILQVVEDSGLSVLSSCQEGTCGTCETTVLAGEVDHRDSLLTPDEQAANDTMFICVSRAACPKLVLEL
jgi:ferredoxin-NADP reductase